MKKILFLNILFIAYLIGCSSGGSNEKTPESLFGTYRTCFQAVGSSDFQQITLTIEEPNQIDAFIQYFANSNCTGPTATQSESGTFSIVGENKINYKYDGISTIFDIYDLNSGVLRFGNKNGTNDGSSDAKRPTVLDNSALYIKL